MECREEQKSERAVRVIERQEEKAETKAELQD